MAFVICNCRNKKKKKGSEGEGDSADKEQSHAENEHGNDMEKSEAENLEIVSTEGASAGKQSEQSIIYMDVRINKIDL